MSEYGLKSECAGDRLPTAERELTIDFTFTYSHDAKTIFLVSMATLESLTTRPDLTDRSSSLIQLANKAILDP